MKAEIFKTLNLGEVIVLTPKNKKEKRLLESIWNNGCQLVLKENNGEIWLRARKDIEKQKFTIVVKMLEIDWNLMTLKEMVDILTEHDGYIDGDKKKVVIKIR